MADFDAIFVGSGISSLVGAAVLARKGWRVVVLERNDRLGGAIRTEEITLPGFAHDVLSGWHPLFTGSQAYRELRSDLEQQGLRYLNTAYPTATLFPDGEAIFLSTCEDDNVQEFEGISCGDGEAWRRMMAGFLERADLAFGMLGTELWSTAGLRLAARGWRSMGTRGSLGFGAELLESSRSWLRRSFKSPRLQGLLAPWVLHTGLGPDAAGSGFMTQVIAAALQLGGMPVPQGGGGHLVEALESLIRLGGGICRTDSHVERILLGGGRATGVRLETGETISARRAVLCCVTPSQLYLRLLDPEDVPAQTRQLASNFRHGRGNMQIHIALAKPPAWPPDERFLKTAVIHLTPGLDAVSKAVNEADRGLLPAEATIVVGQPLAVDPSRAPQGKWILWIQLQELPSHPEGDAAGVLDTRGGQWTSALKEGYADRIVERLCRALPGLRESILKRVVLSPADLERMNINLVGGDPYGGDCSLDQFFLWRPLPGLPRHRTRIAGLYHIGASTHPGPGLHGASGYMAAKQLLRRR